jgi:hypothetical protein
MLLAPDGLLIGQAWGTSDENRLANARLIASAPEMLEALREWEHWIINNENILEHFDIPIPPSYFKSKSIMQKATAK